MFNTLTRSINKFKKNVKGLFRQDAFVNPITGLGSDFSRANFNFVKAPLILSQDQLTAIYTSDGIGRRIVNIKVDDALRVFIHAEPELLKEMQRVKTKQKISDAATWARLFGGSVLVAFLDDGLEMDQPLNLNRINKVLSLQAYDRYQISWINADLSQNYYSEYYGEPEVFRITPYTNGEPFIVHRSRLHIFNGERTSNRVRISNDYWDQSVIQAVYNSLKNYGTAMNASAEIIQGFIQAVITVNGLSEMVSGNNGADCGVDELTTRMQLIETYMGVNRPIYLDANGEKYDKSASNVGGLSDLLDRFAEDISATTGIPFSKLKGRAASGLNSTGQNETDNWDNDVEAYRTDEIEPCISWSISLFEAQRIWSSGKRPENFDWKFPSLKVANEKEQAEIRLMAAKLDEVYMDRGSVDPRFIFEQRYASGTFQSDLVIDPAVLKAKEPDDIVAITNEYDNVLAESTKLDKADNKRALILDMVIKNLKGIANE